MEVLPGIPTSFLDELREKSGLKSLPAVDVHTPPAEAAALFNDVGIVAIKGALSEDILGPLRSKSAAVIQDIIRHDPELKGSRGPKRYSFGGSSSSGSQLHHPEWAALVDVPAVTAVLDKIWGSTDYACHTAGGDFCLAGAPGHQNLHADSWFPGCNEFDLAPRIAVNFLIEDQTPFNGPLRLIPGTQHQPHQLAPKVDEESAESLLSTMCPLPAGTALVRDLRIWHGGTPNLSTMHRSMPNVEFTSPQILERIPSKDFQKCIPHNIWQQMSDRGKHLARLLKAPEGKTLNVSVEFDLPLGGCLARNFFDAREPALLFAPCRDALMRKKVDDDCRPS